MVVSGEPLTNQKVAGYAVKRAVDQGATLVVVSDHGMAQVEGGWVTLDQFADLTGFETAGSLLYAKTEEDRARLYNQLKKASSQFQAFRRKDLPADLND